MLELEWLRFKNLLATGNQFIEIDLSKNKKTLVVGVNGSGKTTIIEALCLVLYNRPFRKVVRAKLVNSITNKNLRIEVEFKAAGHQYLVVRGIKPNVFEIHRDGKLIDPPADLRDHQEWLETHVLKMNFRTFAQCVILGSRNFVPFMQLVAAERRSVVENLLDIEVFSVMNTLLKGRIDVSRKEIETSDRDTAEVEAQISLNQKRLEASRKDFETLAQEHETEIAKKEQDYQAIKVEAEHKHQETERLKTCLVEIDENNLNALTEKHWKTQSEMIILTTELEFFKKHATCPTCSQIITEEFRQTKVFDVQSKLEKHRRCFSATGVEMENIKKTMTDNLAVRKDIERGEHGLKMLVVQAKENRWYVTSMQQEVLKLRVKTKTDDITAELEARKVKVKQDRDDILKRAKVFAQAANLLKDGGVKARIVRKFIPWLNTTVNKFLEALDLFVVFDIDEEFNEKIYSRGRDDFTYESLSEGEKLRLDLALLFAWRELGRNRASASVNLLVLDEVLDSSMDPAGDDDFMKVLDTLSEAENIFVISHKAVAMSERFDRTLRFDKVHNFSQLSEDVAA